jgi:DNA-binding MarR family transcriptional regulator
MANDDDDPVAAWRAVLLAQHRVVRAIERDLDRAGLIPLTWYDVLLELKAVPGQCLRMQDLAERVVLSRSRVSRLVDDLEDEGLVVRQPDATDARATHTCLTDKGRRALRRAAPAYLAGIDRYFNRHLSDRDQKAIARALERVVKANPPPSSR